MNIKDDINEVDGEPNICNKSWGNDLSISESCYDSDFCLTYSYHDHYKTKTTQPNKTIYYR